MANRDFAIKTILTASDTQLKAAFGSAGNEVQKLGRKLQNEARQATSLWGKFKDKFKEGFLMGGGMALAGRAADFVVNKIKSIAREIPDFVEKADNIGKVSQKLGITTDSFQRLSYAMNISDVSAETFEATFKKLNMGMGQLKTMSGPIESGLKKLNPQLMMNLRRSKDSTEAFLMTADAIKATVDPAKRAAIAQAVFGKQGQELLPILLQGREGITDLMKETEKYGEILSGDTIEAAGKFQDSQKRLTASLTQIKGVALSALVTTLEPFVTKISEWVGANKELIGSKITSFLSTMVKKGTEFFNMIKPLLPSIMVIGQSVGRFFGDVFKAAGPILMQLSPIIDRLATTLGPLVGDILEKAGPAIVSLASAFTAVLGPALELVGPLLKDTLGLLDSAVSAIDKITNFTDPKSRETTMMGITGDYRNLSTLDPKQFEQLWKNINSGPDFLKNAQIQQFKNRAAAFITPQQIDFIKSGKWNDFADNRSAAERQGFVAPNAAQLSQTALNNNIKVEVNGVPGAQVKVTQNTGQETSSAGRTAPAIPMTRRGGDLE